MVPEDMTLKQQLERMQADMLFVQNRTVAENNRERPRCYGASSDALAAFALGWGPRPMVPGVPLHAWEFGASWEGTEIGRDYPHDTDDLGACELTYTMAPPHLQERMLPVLVEFRRWVLEKTNRHGVTLP